MKIPNHLPQFKQRTVIVTTGKQAARIYTAYKGTIIESVPLLVIPKQTHSDQDGSFRTRGDGTSMRSGSTYEANDDAVIQAFVRKLKSILKKLHTSLGDDIDIYLLVPGPVREQVRSSLPKPWQERVLLVIPGIHYNKQPPEILELIAERHAKIEKKTDK